MEGILAKNVTCRMLLIYEMGATFIFRRQKKVITSSLARTQIYRGYLNNKKKFKFVTISWSTVFSLLGFKKILSEYRLFIGQNIVNFYLDIMRINNFDRPAVT